MRRPWFRRGAQLRDSSPLERRSENSRERLQHLETHMIAAAAFSLLLLQADPAAAAAPAAPDRYARCVAAAEADAQAAYESAMAWANETQDISAFRCAAVALIEQGRAEQGARRLESLASAAE